MFALRRAAARAFAQPSKHIAAIRSAPSSFVVQRAQPAFQRSLTQSIRWRSAAEDAKASPAESEIKGDIDGVEPGMKELENEVVEQSVQEPVRESQRSLNNVQEPVRESQRFPNNADAQAQSSKILYVGNLFFDVTTRDLEEEFARYGKLVNCRVVTDARGQSKGFGFVEFSSVKEAEGAIVSADQKNFQGRRLSVQQHIPRERSPRSPGAFGSNESRPPAPPSKTLFIGNMSFQMSDRDLNDLFRDVQGVIDVRVAVDRRSGQPRGFAHADFLDIEKADAAKKLLENKVIYGRQLKVDFTRNASQGREQRDQQPRD